MTTLVSSGPELRDQTCRCCVPISDASWTHFCLARALAIFYLCRILRYIPTRPGIGSFALTVTMTVIYSSYVISPPSQMLSPPDLGDSSGYGYDSLGGEDHHLGREIVVETNA